MRKHMICLLSAMLVITLASAFALEPFMTRTITSARTTTNDANSQFVIGNGDISNTSELGFAFEGKWNGYLNKACSAYNYGPVWIEYKSSLPQSTLYLEDGVGTKRTIYLPGETLTSGSMFFWIGEDGSTYFARKDKGAGMPDLSYSEALVPANLARKTAQPDQKNPTIMEEDICESLTRPLLTLRGTITDGLTGKPVADMQATSSYFFTPSQIRSNSDGSFSIQIDTRNSGTYQFTHQCYLPSTLALQKGYTLGKTVLKNAVFSSVFNGTVAPKETLGLSDFVFSSVQAWPAAGLTISSDIPVKYRVEYQTPDGVKHMMQGTDYARYQQTSAVAPLLFSVMVTLVAEDGTTFTHGPLAVPQELGCGSLALQLANGKITLGAKQNVTEVTPISCSGCMSDEICFNQSSILNQTYCSSGEWNEQKDAREACSMYYECLSGICEKGVCKNRGFFASILAWFSGRGK